MTRIITSAMRDNYIACAIETHTSKLVDRHLVKHASALTEQQRQRRRELQAEREYREATGERWEDK